MKLSEKRCLFTQLICEHVLWFNETFASEGLRMAFDEGMDRKTTKDPTSDHMNHSNHEIGLAQDIVIYKGGIPQDKTEHHRLSGEKWESRHELCRWGGRFGDGGHYSFEHNGVK